MTAISRARNCHLETARLVFAAVGDGPSSARVPFVTPVPFTRPVPLIAPRPLTRPGADCRACCIAEVVTTLGAAGSARAIGAGVGVTFSAAAGPLLMDGMTWGLGGGVTCCVGGTGNGAGTLGTEGRTGDTTGAAARISRRSRPHFKQYLDSFGERAPHSGHSTVDSSAVSGTPHLGHLPSMPSRARPHWGHSCLACGILGFGMSRMNSEDETFASPLRRAITFCRSVAQTGHLVSPGGTLLPHSGHSMECSLAKLCTSGGTMLNGQDCSRGTDSLMSLLRTRVYIHTGKYDSPSRRALACTLSRSSVAQSQTDSTCTTLI